MSSKTIVNTTRRIYWFDENYTLFEITDLTDIFYDVVVEEPVNEGQYKDIYIVTNNYRHPKRWNGVDLQVEDLGGLSDIGVIRARTMEINNNHVIFGNIAKNGGGPGASNPIDSINTLIDDVSTLIDAYGTTPATGYKRFNKTVVWSDVLRPEYYLPDANNQAGDIDFDEDGYEIVRIKKLAEFNVTYKEKSIWLLINVGLPFIYVKKFFTESVGLLAVNAVVEAGNVHYFVGHDFDIWRFDGVNVTNLSSDQNIKDYIKARIDNDTIYQTHAYSDFDRKEVYFSFYGKEDITKPFRQFEVVYNYETQQFSRRDSIAKCGGYFEQTKDSTVIDDIATTIDDVQDTIDRFGIFGTPQRKLLIGDRLGLVHLANEGDSANGEELPGYFETGDEDYAAVSRDDFTNHSKVIERLQLLVEDVGINKDFLFEVGVRDSFDGQIRWKGPYRYKQDGNGNGKVSPRANGVYHRFRFTSPSKNQFIRIVGYVGEVKDYGEILR